MVGVCSKVSGSAASTTGPGDMALKHFWFLGVWFLSFGALEEEDEEAREN